MTEPLILTARQRDLGAGMKVRRLLPAGKVKLVGPFIFFDEMGPVNFDVGEGIDVRPHPHIGLTTVTWLLEGELLHRDSLGYAQTIQSGALNLMTAGSGIVHSERSSTDRSSKTRRLHGIQTWMALPTADEETTPTFVHHPSDAIPRIEADDHQLDIILGNVYDQQSPAQLFSPTFYVQATLSTGAVVDVPNHYEERAAYVIDGEVSCDGTKLTAGQMLILPAHKKNFSFAALMPSRMMLLGGDALDGERHIWWNFVSSSPARIEQAKADWLAERFAAVPGETEFTPLPKS